MTTDIIVEGRGVSVDKKEGLLGVWMGGGFQGEGDLLVSKYATGHYIQLHHHVLCCII